MPRIWWNGQVQSSRNLRHLAKIELVGYKRLMEDDGESASSHSIKVVLQWQEEPAFANHQAASGIELSEAAK